MKYQNSLFIVLCILLQGCALKVGLMNPQPNINLPETKQTIALVIENNIRDVHTIPSTGSVKKTNVIEWHTSLRNGFKNGFEDSYKVIDNEKNADIVLKLSTAKIQLAPAAVGSYSGTLAVWAHIKYKATLVDKSGKSIGRSANTATSKSACTSPPKISETVSSAVESMYELIAKDLE